MAYVLETEGILYLRFNKEHNCWAIHPFASLAVDGCKPNGIHDWYFEGVVVALAGLTAFGLHSGTASALLCSSDSYAIFSLLYYCFPLQSLGCFLQYPSLFYSNERLSCHSLPGADTYIVAKCFSLLSDNPHDLMCPVCLCSYKLALNNRIVCIPAHKVGRVRKVSLVDIIVLP